MQRCTFVMDQRWKALSGLSDKVRMTQGYENDAKAAALRVTQSQKTADEANTIPKVIGNTATAIWCSNNVVPKKHRTGTNSP